MFKWPSNNRVAQGMLTGALSGGMMGIAGGPAGIAAGMALGATMGAMTGEEANKEAWAARQEKKAGVMARAEEQNAETKRDWEKRKNAMAIGAAGGGGTLGSGSIVEGNNQQAAGLTSLV